MLQIWLEDVQIVLKSVVLLQMDQLKERPPNRWQEVRPTQQALQRACMARVCTQAFVTDFEPC